MDHQKFHKADTSSKYQGIYYRNSARGKIWWIAYRRFGRLVWEKIGHEADGITKVHAREFRAERLRKIKLGEILPDEQPKMTVDQAFEFYRKNVAADGIKLGSDLSRYNNHIKPYIGDMPLNQVTTNDVVNLKDMWMKRGFASGHRRSIQAFASRLFNHAISAGVYSGKNPFASVTKPNASGKRERYITESEANLILSTMKAAAEKSPGRFKLRAYQAVAISLFTGLRKSEIARLTRRNFVADWSQIKVKTKYRRKDVTRSVQVPQILQPIIQSIQWPDDRPYFIGPRFVKKISEYFVSVIDQLGINDGAKGIIERVTFHSLRHTYGSWHALNGTPLNVIRELMGHTDISTTERYLHLAPDHKREAVENFSRKFVEMSGKIGVPDDYIRNVEGTKKEEVAK